MKDDDVKFAGYRVPHPLEDFMEMKVQTNGKHPNEVVRSTLHKIQRDLFDLQGDFEEMVKLKSN